MKQSGGYIWVYSEPGKGTTFKVYLPRAERRREAVPRQRRAADDDCAGGTETVLVVEDEEAVRLLTRRILERAGYRVYDAANPEQAQALFERTSLFSLLVTDVVMPGASGPKLFEERLVRQHPDLKVLYVSGYTDTAIIDGGRSDWANRSSAKAVFRQRTETTGP